jgi:putative transposase
VTETNVFQLTQPGTFFDPLTEVLRNGARTLLGQAVEAEVAAWLSTHTDKLTEMAAGDWGATGICPSARS